MSAKTSIAIIVCSVLLPIGYFLVFRKLPEIQLKVWFLKSSFVVLSIITVVLGVTIYRFLEPRAKLLVVQLASRKWFLVSLLGLFLIVQWKVPNQYRVLSDEVNLLAVGHSFFHEFAPTLNTQGNYFKEKYKPKVQKDPKRPIFFGYLTSLAHFTFGYNYKHGFWLNNLLLFFAVFILFMFLVNQQVSPIVSTFTILCLFSHPVFLTAVYSSGFDTFSAIMLMVLLVLSLSHKSKFEKNRWDLIFVIAIIHFFLRYEYVVFAFLVLAYLYLTRREEMNRYMMERPFFILALSALTLPRFLQHFVTQTKHQENWDKSVLSFEYIPKNLEEFLKGITQLVGSPYNTVTLSILAVAIALAIGVTLKRKVKPSRLNKAEVFLITLWLCSCIVYLSHYFGKATHPAGARYFILPILGLTGLLLILSKEALEKFRIPLLIAGIAAFVFGSSEAKYDKVSAISPLVVKTNYLYEWLDRQDFLGHTTIITERPGHYIVKGMSALNFDSFNSNEKHWSNQMFEKRVTHLIAFQRIRKHNDKPYRKQNISSSWDVEILDEFHYNSSTYVRVSKLTPIDPMKIEQK